MANSLGMLEKPYQNNAWYASYQEIIAMINRLVTRDNVYFVGPAWADANLGAEIGSAVGRRLFPTLQAAHDAVTSGTGYDNRAVIFVDPGNYYENLTITKTVAFVSTVPAYADGLGAFRPVRLYGNASVQSPLVTISPPDSTELAVGFSGFYFENKYNVTAGTIVKAHTIDFRPQTTYGSYQNKLALTDCDVRMQTYGNGNEWWAGIWAEGWVDVRLRRCNVFAGSHGGGANNAGITNLFLLAGHHGNGKSATIRVDQSAIAHFYRGILAGSPTMFYMSGGSAGVFSRSAALLSNSPLYAQSTYSITAGGGTNTIDGFTSPATYGNLLGVNLTGL